MRLLTQPATGLRSWHSRLDEVIHASLDMRARQLALTGCGLQRLGFILIALTAMASEPKSVKMSLRSFLELAGVKLDCYFTVEESSKDRLYWIFNQPVDASKLKMRSVCQLIESLNKEVKEVVVWQDTGNRAILHIIDKKLRAKRNYVLDQRVSLTYAGPIQNCVEAIGKVCKDLRSKYLFGIGDEVVGFDQTKVSILAKDMKIRDVLTDFLPLSDCNRILWLAESDPDGIPGHMTVQFLGPKHALPVPIRHIDEFKFSEGERAYEVPSALLEATGQRRMCQMARQYIEAQMNKRSPSQVRWAMFFLGKNKCEEAIPTLVRFIKYRYTNSRVKEEAYPALKALRQIGAHAFRAAQERVKTADDNEEIGLLCDVMVSVKGRHEARKALAAELANTRSEKSKDRLAIALRYCTKESK